MASPAASRRRIRFGMSTLIVAMTVVAGWVAFELNWVRQRHAVLQTWFAYDTQDEAFQGVEELTRAPGGLFLFGERGYKYVDRISRARPDGRLTAAEQAELERVQKLFPEAEVSWSFWPVAGWRPGPDEVP